MSQGGCELRLYVGGGEIAGGFAEALDVVKSALFGEKDVDDDVYVVEENPLGLAAAFDGGGVEAEIPLQAQFDFVGYRYDLTVVGGGGDEKEVGETGVCGIEFEDAGVFAFFIVAGGDGGQELTAGFRSCHRVSSSPCTLEEAPPMLAGSWMREGWEVRGMD